VQERCNETGVGVTIEVAAQDDDDGDDDDGEKDDQKINSKSNFRPPQSRNGTITYSTGILGVRLRYHLVLARI
jgi:hypothetical protein